MIDRTTECYPVCLNLAGKTCVVVGGGAVAERKASSLLEAGARVVVVSPQLTDPLRRYRDEGRIAHVARPYAAGDLAAAFLAIIATDDQSANHAAAAEAEERGILANVVDDPDRSSFIAPAVFRRGDLWVAVSTGGRSPAMARLVRDRLADLLTPGHLALLAAAIEVRARLKASGRQVAGKAWRRALDAELTLPAQRGDPGDLSARLMARLLEEGPAGPEP